MSRSFPPPAALGSFAQFRDFHPRAVHRPSTSQPYHLPMIKLCDLCDLCGEHYFTRFYRPPPLTTWPTFQLLAPLVKRSVIPRIDATLMVQIFPRDCATRAALVSFVQFRDFRRHYSVPSRDVFPIASAQIAAPSVGDGFDWVQSLHFCLLPFTFYLLPWRNRRISNQPTSGSIPRESDLQTSAGSAPDAGYPRK